MNELQEMAKELIKDEDDIEESVVRGQIKDELKMDRIIRDKKLDSQKDELSKFNKKKKIKKVFQSILTIILYPLRIDTYVKIIQNFENLLFIVFVDSLMIFILSALGYIIYTAWRSTNEYIKIGGCTIICLLCIFAQMYIENNIKTKSPDTEVNPDEE